MNALIVGLTAWMRSSVASISSVGDSSLRRTMPAIVSAGAKYRSRFDAGSTVVISLTPMYRRPAGRARLSPGL
jgi:hypothetical protein